MWISPPSTGISEPTASASVIATCSPSYLRIEELELEAGG
jgi:hypothetical protein